MEPSIAALEAHALRAWPATVTETAPGGWILRATPGLDRGRSNHALTPPRALEARELLPALEQVLAFAARHGMRPGLQVSPLDVHRDLVAELGRRRWERRWPTLVMTRRAAAPAAAPGAELTVEPAASSDWLRVWGRCEGRTDVEAHARTVFAHLRGRAGFVRLGEDAAAIAVPGGGLLGIFSLAVAPDRRRQGVARRLVSALLERHAQSTAYLQVEARNAPAIALYAQLGFREAYRYCHFVAPDGSAEQAHDGEDADRHDERPQAGGGQPTAPARPE